MAAMVYVNSKAPRLPGFNARLTLITACPRPKRFAPWNIRTATKCVT
jgi:hypothetical protein